MTSSKDLVKIAKAATQLTPFTAFGMRIVDERAAEVEKIRISRALQVIEHRVTAVRESANLLEDIVKRHAILLKNPSITKSDVHAFIAGLIISNAAISEQEIVGHFYLEKIFNLGYAEILVLLDCSGYVIDETSEAHLSAVKSADDHLYTSIAHALTVIGLLNDDQQTIPSDLAALLEVAG